MHIQGPQNLTRELSKKVKAFFPKIGGPSEGFLKRVAKTMISHSPERLRSFFGPSRCWLRNCPRLSEERHHAGGGTSSQVCPHDSLSPVPLPEHHMAERVNSLSLLLEGMKPRILGPNLLTILLGRDARMQIRWLRWATYPEAHFTGYQQNNNQQSVANWYQPATSPIPEHANDDTFPRPALLRSWGHLSEQLYELKRTLFSHHHRMLV